jgi:hypothetical protein
MDNRRKHEVRVPVPWLSLASRTTMRAGVRLSVLLCTLLTAPVMAGADRLPGPVCVRQPEKSVCQLGAGQIRRRELEIVQTEWRRVREALSNLSTAELSIPSGGADEVSHRQYCGALKDDLLAGRVRLISEPDVSSSEVGLRSFSGAWDAMQSECVGADRYNSNRLLTGGAFTNDGGLWLEKFRGGYAVFAFDLPASAYYFDYRYGACKRGSRLPHFVREGGAKQPNRTETLALAVVSRGENELVALELGAVYGFGDELRHHAYGASLDVSPTWLSDSSSPPKISANSEGRRFIGAFVLPPPLRPALTQHREYDDRGESGEPCVWNFVN